MPKQIRCGVRRRSVDFRDILETKMGVFTERLGFCTDDAVTIASRESFRLDCDPSQSI